MALRSGAREHFWTVAGAVLLIAFMGAALHYRRDADVAARTASVAKRVDLVGRMRAALSASSEAEKSAVMATTDSESQALAAQARASMTIVKQRRDELAELLGNSGTTEERRLLAEFTRDLADCEQIDREVLDLAVKNTNLKAYALAFGPAQDELTTMDGALSTILSRSVASADPEARRTMLLAAGAQSAAWRIQSMVAPHISEESDSRMDSLEARMTVEDRSVRSDLKALESTSGSLRPELDKAAAAYARFAELRKQILDLSRQNTNVRSLILSLNQQRRAVQICLDALTALEQAFRAESRSVRPPIPPR